MNKSFSFAFLGDEEKAIAILEQNEKIFSVPVVDENHCICCEYVNENRNEDEDAWDFKEIIMITKEIYVLRGNYEKIYVVLQTISEEEKNITDEITKKTKEGIIFLEVKDRLKLREYAKDEKIFVVEPNIGTYKVGEIFYKKINVESMGLDRNFSIDNIETYIRARISYFRRIAVLESDMEYFQKIAGDLVDIITFNMDNCVWDEEKEYYVYTKEMEEGIECLFTYCCINEPYVVLEGKQCILPIISVYYKDNLVARKSSDADVAANIVPLLLHNGIACILIRNPDEEYDSVEGRFKEDIKLRRLSNVPAIFYSYDKDEGEAIREEIGKLIAITENACVKLVDYSGKYINSMNGVRNTVGNELNCKYKLFLFGPCIVLGTYVKDEDTIASLINQRKEFLQYTVYNYGISSWPSMNIIMRKQIFTSNDMVVLFGYCSDIYQYCNLKMNSIIQGYRNMPDIEHNVWNSLLHVNAIGNRYVTEEICRIIKENYSFPVNTDVKKTPVTFGTKKKIMDIPPALERWFHSVESHIDKTSSNAGAIVMNCNPFTKGHRYLIESAAKLVDILYVFVVEEDKSYFAFTDRLRMVEMGTKDLENVVVMPSGNYMISTVTLPGYFNKEECPEVNFDATKDLSVFSEVIAPWFGIKVRFAGEEPTDHFTSRYNWFMKELLPQHGIQFIEIPRKEEGGKVISAKRVRELLKSKEYEEIKKLVPMSTYQYLEQMGIL